MNVLNKKVIITGAGSGIGKSLTEELLKKGAYVCALDINYESLHNLKEELRSTKLTTYVVDVSNKESINTFKDTYLKNNNELDILINNAGIIQPFKSVIDIDDETIKRVMDINFYGPLNLTRAFLPTMINKNEKYIVNVSSMGGFFPFPYQTIYGASKAALKLFTEGLYAELLDTNIKIMVVFPGAIDTNITKNSNVTINTQKATNYKMTSASKAADAIIKSIERNKYKLYIGSDSKFMHWFYNFNSKLAIKMVQKKMKGING